MIGSALNVVNDPLDVSERRWHPRLFHIVETDDITLKNSPDAEWFDVLLKWDWKRYRELGAEYYEALYRFNQQATQRRLEAESAMNHGNEESKDEARQRLLFERPTAGNSQTPILFETPVSSQPVHIDPEEIGPGKVPSRLAGKQPKCFFSLLKSFVGVTLMGHAAEPENIRRELVNNPAFARVCGFMPADAYGLYDQRAIPSLRKLEQFDQIMTENGLWSKCKWDEIRTNINSGLIKAEREIVHDTTHYHAYSCFEVVKYEDEKGKQQKKSQAKVGKSCGCKEKETCPHEWRLVDDGAGTVVKSANRMYWAHKASMLALPRQGVPLDAVAVTDAASHDSHTLEASLRRLFDNLPLTRDWFDYVLDDGAAYDLDLMARIEEELGLRVRASMNPRRRPALIEDLPRGMAKLTPYGDLIRMDGHTMEYRGVRWQTDSFIYGPALDEQQRPHCLNCLHRSGCCPHADKGRQATVHFDKLPHIQPKDPPMAKRFKAMMTRRPAVERVIKRVKCDFGEPQLTKRGNAAFQARLDKSMIALHVLLRT